MELVIRNPGVPVDEATMNAIESQLPATLPNAYRQFLARHNGGYPEPAVFRIRWADPRLGAAHARTEVGYFYSADGEDARLADYYRMYGDRLPPGYLAVADDPGGDSILLGLEGEARGKVFYWIHDMDPDYDEADPANLGFVAESWDAFLAGPYQPDD